MISSQIRPLALSVLIAIAIPGIVHAASFDCSAASTKVEGLICSNAYVSHLDDLLAADYAKVKAINPNAVEEQRAWIATRNECDSTQCVMDAYLKRSSQLHYQLELGQRPTQAASGEALNQGESDVTTQPASAAQQTGQQVASQSALQEQPGPGAMSELAAQQMSQQGIPHIDQAPQIPSVQQVEPNSGNRVPQASHDFIGIGIGIVISLSIIGAIFKYINDRRCPSCGKWSARVTESSQETGSSVRYEQQHLTDTYRNRSGQITGTKERTEIIPVKYTAYRHQNHCKFCGYTWQSESESRSKFQ
ncbi:exported hypothetical protein [Paraburkholderia tropica]